MSYVDGRSDRRVERTSEDLKEIFAKLSDWQVERQMNLTEPHAGSDLSKLRTSRTGGRSL